MAHKAAGILFVTLEGKALFLKRGPGGDAPGCWSFSGGTTEDDETPEQTAKREAKEELGSLPAGDMVLHCRTILPVPSTIGQPVAVDAAPVVGADMVDFTTFVQKVAEEFIPKLNGEHVGWCWAPITEPPEPLHPGCRVALDRFTMDELGVARAMRDGFLSSPQQYANIALYDIRITGTGISYRSAKTDDDGKEIAPEEFVYRKPENYLQPDFLERCQGLSVIYMHPKTVIMNSEEFASRVVGAVMLPYIKGDEVWAIVRIYDAEMIAMLQSEQMSTSPAVLLGKGDVRIKLETGEDMLIEGPAKLLDHICLTRHGVWDKGGIAGPGVRMDSQDDAAPSPVFVRASQWRSVGVHRKLDVALSKTRTMVMDGLSRRILG